MADGSDLTTATTRPLSAHDRGWMREAARQRAERAIRAATCRVSTVTERFVVDTNAYYPLAEPPERWLHVAGLCLAGHVELLMTDIQHDEISANRDVETVVRVLSLPATNVPAFGVILGLTRLNMARFGDPDLLGRLRAPGDDGVPAWPHRPRVPSHNESRKLQFRSRDTADALLAATAHYERAVFVTRDKDITPRARNAGIVVWDPDRFIRHIDSLAW